MEKSNKMENITILLHEDIKHLCPIGKDTFDINLEEKKDGSPFTTKDVLEEILRGQLKGYTK